MKDLSHPLGGNRALLKAASRGSAILRAAFGTIATLRAALRRLAQGNSTNAWAEPFLI